MEKYLRPDKLFLDPAESDATEKWTHWKTSFEYFLTAVGETEGAPLSGPQKLRLLTNLISTQIYKSISEIRNFDRAMQALEKTFVQPKNTVFCRHLLATRRQKESESIDQYLLSLKGLAKDCEFTAASALEARDEHIMDAFINGVSSGVIRQRLLENKTLNLSDAYDQALAIENAQKQMASYSQTPPITAAVPVTEDANLSAMEEPSTAAAVPGQKCWFCGNKRHDRSRCPARDVSCRNCKKKGHFSKMCNSPAAAAMNYGESLLISSATPSKCPKSISRASLCGTIKGTVLKILIDTGSSESFIHPDKAKYLRLCILPSSERIMMACSSHHSSTLGHCTTTLCLNGREYKDLKLSLMADLCCDIILGHDFLDQHSSVEIPFGGPLLPLIVCGLAAIKNIPYPSLFSNLTHDYRPIAVKS